jgi:hypothetical protein
VHSTKFQINTFANDACCSRHCQTHVASICSSHLMKDSRCSRMSGNQIYFIDFEKYEIIQSNLLQPAICIERNLKIILNYAVGFPVLETLPRMFHLSDKSIFQFAFINNRFADSEEIKNRFLCSRERFW